MARLHGRARWVLHPDGRALLLPAPGHVADDLCPLAGHWTPDGAGTRVAVRRASNPWRSLSVAGTIGPDGFTGTHEMLDGDDLHVHEVRAPLAADDHGPAGWATEVGGVPVPFVATGMMRGMVHGRLSDDEFGPIPVALSVLDAVPGAATPVEILLSPDDPGALGGVLWLSGAPGLDREDTGDLTITATGGRVDARVTNGTDASLGVTFTIGPDGVFDAGIPGLAVPAPAAVAGIGVPVAARQARLTLAVAAAGSALDITGELDVRGSVPTGPVAVTATITARAATAPDPDADGFDRLWSAAGP